MDVKNAFLYSGLNEKVYMKLPYGMLTYSNTNICKLNLFKHGLKNFASLSLGFYLLRVSTTPFFYSREHLIV